MSLSLETFHKVSLNTLQLNIFYRYFGFTALARTQKAVFVNMTDQENRILIC